MRLRVDGAHLQPGAIHVSGKLHLDPMCDGQELVGVDLKAGSGLEAAHTLFRKQETTSYLVLWQQQRQRRRKDN